MQYIIVTYIQYSLYSIFFSDIKERFTNYVLLLIVCLRNMEQFSWNPGMYLLTDTVPSNFTLEPQIILLHGIE